MSTLADLTEADVLSISAALGEPEWLRDRRQEAYKAFADLDWPTNRDEDWRYTNPRRFKLDRPIATVAGTASTSPGRIIAPVAERLAGSARLVDGRVAAVTVGAEAAEQGVVVTDLATAARDHEDVVREHLGTVIDSDEKFAALSLAAFTAGLLVYVPAGVELADPIALSLQATAQGAVLPRLLVVLGASARLSLYVDHVGATEATVVEAIEAVLGDGAHLDMVSAQDWGAGVGHIGVHRATVGRDATYRQLEVTLGGDTVYLRPDVSLDGTGGSAELLGVYLGTGAQQFEHRSLIRHNASHTSSESVYKGTLKGTSRSTWFGNIRIEPHAKATSSDETNRNLILSDGARADSIPFLEILTSDVLKCGHHSSVGQIDELQLFYLQSRGIPRDEAQRLLVFGFFSDVLDRIELPGVTEVVLGELEREL